MACFIKVCFVINSRSGSFSLPASWIFQVLAAVGYEEAEQLFQRLLLCLSHPPSHTCVRASTHLAPLEEIRHELSEELKKVSLAGVLGVDISLLWKTFTGVCCFPSSRCATPQWRRFRLFHTHRFKMFYYFLLMAQGMRGMVKLDSSTLS